MRSHPYDLVFGLPQFEDETFPAIREDAETHNVDVNDMERFSLLATVGELMRSLLPEGSSRTAYEQFRAIVWHAWHYWNKTGRYIELPRNLIFAKMEEGAAEAIDGFFVVGDHVLFVLGVMDNRPGFSVIEAIAHDDGNANFENILPGGEDRLQGVRNQSDLNALAAKWISTQ